MASEYGYLFLFIVLGAGLKIIDDVYDKGVPGRKWAYALAPLLALIWIYLSNFDKGYATILGAVLLSSLLAGKVDNAVFKVSAAAISIAWLILGVDVIIVPFIVLVLLGVVDELLDRYGERMAAGAGYLMRHRVGMKVGVLLLLAAGYMDTIHVLSLLAFDLAYELAPASVQRALYLNGVAEYES
jgi:hypothetical protein